MRERGVFYVYGRGKSGFVRELRVASVLIFEGFDRAGFEGEVASGLAQALTEDRLRNLKSEVIGEEDGLLAKGRHRVVVLTFEVGGEMRRVAVKAFGRQQKWMDRNDRKRGSKAARSSRAARFLVEHGVATPRPLGHLDRWEGAVLVESYYFSDYVEGLTSFKSGLQRIYRGEEVCAVLVSLLEKVGAAMRKMHDAGFIHRDLGNQNMELSPPQDGEWGEVHFIDLNRGRIREEVGVRERALDFARLHMPSAFVDVLVRIYWDWEIPPGFMKALHRARRRFGWWNASRKWRHPIRSLKISRRSGGARSLRMKDVWIWDDRSGQAAITLSRADRKRCHSWVNHLRVASSNLLMAGGLWREYRRQLEGAFGRKVELADRIGMALEPADLDWEPQLGFLKELGSMPVLLRFGHHEGREQWEKTAGFLEALRRDGHAVMVAVLQDRRAILDPDSWKEFLEFVFENVDGKVVGVEICHVINRVKWGVHNLREYRDLMSPVEDLRRKYPELRVTGPACIDFEFHYTIATLAALPGELRLDALSHHLYVDRRGAPENRQGQFGTVEKSALLKAIAVRSKRCDEEVIVSEANWPLQGTGVWSPVSASITRPGAVGSKVHVTEEQYGCFMLRYLVLTLCSGFVDRVYWWRLVAHGYGLIDERAEGGWRKRPAFQMLAVFLRELGAATFVEKHEVGDDVYAFRFERAEGQVTMMWCNGRTYDGPWPVDYERVINALGEEISLTEVGEAPVYLVS